MLDEAAFRKKVLCLAQELPSTPAVLGKLQRLLTDPNSGLDAICALLKRDMGLSARILRVSNSVYFGPSAAHSTLEEAVGCVGYREIYRVVGVTIARQFLNRDLRAYNCTARRLWENVVCSALAMESLAQFAGINPRSAYTAGLMRSVGMILLDRMADVSNPAPAPYSAESGDPVGNWEAAAFGCDNPAVAALLLKEWEFPEEVCEAVRNHYRPAIPTVESVTACVLNCAGRVARDLGFGLAGEDPYWEPDPVVLGRAGLAESEIALCTEETGMAFDAVRQTVADAEPEGRPAPAHA
jgi:HD-like signal output (HDOD) protein